MNMSFYAGKRILITGATGGLGTALVKKLQRDAARLILTSRSETKLNDLISMLDDPSRAIPLRADLSQPGSVNRLVDEALKQAGHIDLLFNLAGLGYFALMEEADEEKIRYLFEVNTFAPLMLMKSLIPHMRMRGGGRIVNIVSSAGRVPIPTVGVYDGSKSALAVMSNTMRLELEPKGIDILNIYPGTVSGVFERHAIREGNRSGLCPAEECGQPEDRITDKIIEAAAGAAGEVWLEKPGKWMALAAIAWPGLTDNRLKSLRNRVIAETDPIKHHQFRKWRLWQVETSIACNLKCIMCPWEGVRDKLDTRGHMSQQVWDALVPYLNDVKSVDFAGGGEPLLQKNLLSWIEQAKSHGCDTGFLTNGLLLKPDMSDRLIDTGLNWIGFSVDGADKETYEAIRQGSDFDQICEHIRYLTEKRVNQRPLVMVNVVIMTRNVHQLEDMIKLADRLGVDQVNFKQCDVIRGDYGKGHGLFASQASKQTDQLKKALDKASRLAKKLNIKVTTFSFVPEEQPVCEQDPRDSVFIRYDGSISPCINLAIGGPSTFLGEEIVFPTVSYGNLSQHDLLDLWRTETCRFYRKQFENRVKSHDRVLASYDHGHSILKLKEAFQAAIKAMPEAPEGCARCHYLYDI